MARIAVLGTLAVDRVVRLDRALRVGAHQQGHALEDRCGGGAANAAVALARAGHRVLLVSAVGDDAAGRRLLETQAAAGVDTREVAILPGATSHSLLLVDPSGERTIVNLRRLHAPAPERLLDQELDAVYVRSRAPGLAPLLAELARRTRVIAHIPPCADGAVPAHVLVGSAADLAPGFLADPHAGGQRASGGLAAWTVVTHGSDGATAHGPDGPVARPAPAVRAVDSTGAGDCFAAGLVHALAAGLPMERVLAIACAWGGAAVATDGSLPGAGFPPPDPP
ncbi:MAG: PfkB family carbohydrate kinase [Gammaproteobacteria bacterium]|nr:PfkB family carbohydrate kinase [Gammaproteobacteria bacterium]